MALSKIDVANMLTGATPVANGGTGLSSGTTNEFLKFTGSTTLASADDNAGISMAQMWRLHSSATGDADPITSNLEAVDTDGYGGIGSAMSESSGIFTFPSTGIYLIQMTLQIYYSGDSRINQLKIMTTTDNSSYDDAAKNSTHIKQAESSHTYSSATNSFIFDVTDTTTHKVKFGANVNNDSATIVGSTSVNRTHFYFIRLGDT